MNELIFEIDKNMTLYEFNCLNGIIQETYKGQIKYEHMNRLTGTNEYVYGLKSIILRSEILLKCLELKNVNGFYVICD